MDSFIFNCDSDSSSEFNLQETETKPVLENILVNIPEPAPTGTETTHSFHDFNIHIELRRESGSQIVTLPQEVTAGSSNNSVTNTHRQQSCSSSFVAETCCGNKSWTASEVVEVITIESAYFRMCTLTIKFPDKKINTQIVSNLNQSIRSVHFLHSPYARRCCVTIKDTSKRDQILTKLNSTRFGSGYISADDNFDELIPPLNDIDPFTLFLDNVPNSMSSGDLCRVFSTSQQITIAEKNKIHYTKRYAFIVYPSINAAIEAFRSTNRSTDMTVRFRRFSGSTHLPSKRDIEKYQSNTNTKELTYPLVIDLSMNLVDNEIVKHEPPFTEIVVDDAADHVETTGVIDECPSTDFNMLYRCLQQSRLQKQLLLQLNE